MNKIFLTVLFAISLIFAIFLFNFFVLSPTKDISGKIFKSITAYQLENIYFFHDEIRDDNNCYDIKINASNDKEEFLNCLQKMDLSPTYKTRSQLNSSILKTTRIRFSINLNGKVKNYEIEVNNMKQTKKALVFLSEIASSNKNFGTTYIPKERYESGEFLKWIDKIITTH